MSTWRSGEFIIYYNTTYINISYMFFFGCFLRHYSDLLKIEVLFFPRGAPRGGSLPGGGPQGGGPRGGSRELFGLPIWRKTTLDNTLGVVYHAAFDFDAPRSRNTAQKS